MLTEDIERAKTLVENVANEIWPDRRKDIKVIYCQDVPTGAYYRDSRPLNEPGWHYFAVVGTYDGVGGSPLYCAHPASGEVLSLGFVGE